MAGTASLTKPTIKAIVRTAPPEQWAQAGRLIRAGVPRQQVAIIYDVGLSTHGLYWILLSANRKGVKKRDYRANLKHGGRLWHPVNL
ncbi:helix-turn-helix domain-containing protein [Salmonella enterica]|nr:helix-turn-helix domain-containing protein [Salmonella enterica]EKI0834632.1 helix-turn-helix domain-containing protein [Salmonella enterica]